MAINIKDPDTDAKARELARLTGEGLTEAVRVAIEQRLARESLRGRAGIAEHLLALAARFGNRKRLFPGSADEAAYVRFGKGCGHPAQLNFGDCMSYALARVSGEPLLFKGSDFSQTDIAAVSWN